MAKTRRLRLKRKQQQQQVGEGLFGRMRGMFTSGTKQTPAESSIISAVDPNNTALTSASGTETVPTPAVITDDETKKRNFIVSKDIIYNLYNKHMQPDSEFDIIIIIEDYTEIVSNLVKIADSPKFLEDEALKILIENKKKHKKDKKPTLFDIYMDIFKALEKLNNQLDEKIEEIEEIEESKKIINYQEQVYNLMKQLSDVVNTYDTSSKNVYRRWYSQLSRIGKAKENASIVAERAVDVAKGVGYLGKSAMMGLIRAGGFSRKTRSKKSRSKKTRKHRRR
jgi:hypothetical protein